MSVTQLKIYGRAAAITPNDSTDIPGVGFQDGSGNRGCQVYVGGAGDVKVDLRSGDTVTFSAVPAGLIIPADIIRVYSTGTTATLLIALW